MYLIFNDITENYQVKVFFNKMIQQFIFKIVFVVFQLFLL